MSIRPPVRLSLHQSVYLSFHSVYLYISLSKCVCLYASPFVCLSVILSVYKRYKSRSNLSPINVSHY